MSKAAVLEQPQESEVRASQAQNSDIIGLAHDGQQNTVGKVTQANFLPIFSITGNLTG